MTTLLFILIIIFLFTSAPIFVALGLGSFLSVVFMSDTDPMILVQRMFGGLDQFALMALPFFIFAANIMEGGGLSDRILRWARALVGHMAGGVAMTTQVSSMFFGALSGSSPATVIAIGKIMYPELLRREYSPSFSAGLLASAGSISLIIPPSITLIVLGSVITTLSVSDLFTAGIGAGLIIGLVTIAYIYWFSKKHNMPRDTKATKRELFASTRSAFWALLIPVIILGGIYGGIFTPTEAAGIAAVYALAISVFVYREMSWQNFYRVCVDSAITSAQVLVLVAAAQILGWLLTRGGLPQQIATFMTENIESVLLFFLVLNVALLFMGMFMEGIAAIIIVAPLIFPAAMQMGIDPVHLGIVMIVNLAIGMYTPPFGINIFVTQTISDLDMVEMIPGLRKFLFVQVIALLIITYIPASSLFLLYLFN
ncbi:TRAP transporter large permease [Salisediminibacterium halotolerans]|uniref:TRAP transporter large permease n=1 Tax=Salisediminibacterium halotolerans TaxID=517425 RepID=UPI000EB0B06D|nr:TRAP transporter large permease [Salisediminibacterium halotolerans]RLJ75757.1 C4-dicarboxylate transporter DctM subunit [Actinophytocola xinjiangensis]RPE89611.1 C4-dicarboxylate transporter DctM subunit [Salisediminibacterium halotolerans]TWG36370.1 C4-dicarboxylate transporter DctM subunit [Salisediminibacterium halotolerans]GEL08892.1 C4-dicarboxylate TRAP transporter large permease protein DctM [Salisediminibacterium halotolerans]